MTVYWDATKIAAFMKCEQYFDYKHVLGLKRKNGFAEPLMFGIAVHEWMQFWDEAPEDATVEQAIAAGVLHDIAARNELSRSEDKRRGVNSLLRIAVAWEEERKRRQYATLVMENGTVASELHFKIEMKLGVIFSGYIDRLVIDAAGNIFVLDYKSSLGALSSHWAESYRGSIQMSMYQWAAEKITDKKIAGVMLQGIQPLVSGIRFQEFPITLPRAVAAENVYGAFDLISRDKTNGPLKNLASCEGKYSCEFKDVCTKFGQVKKMKLDSDWEAGEIWNPSEVRKPHWGWENGGIVKYDGS